MFEALVIDWLKEASIAAVARQLKLSWNAVDGIMHRAVAHGLKRCKRTLAQHLGVHETASHKGHDYVTIVSSGATVLHVADDRKQTSLDGYYASLTDTERTAIESVSVDM